MCGVRGGEHLLTMRAHRGGLTEVHDGGREEAQAAVPMVLVVPTKEDLPERSADRYRKCYQVSKGYSTTLSRSWR